MKILFIIGSAIHTKHGCFSAEQRLNQTLDTLKSVREKIPNAIINVNESSGEKSISEEERSKLKIYANQITDYSQDQQVQQIYKMTDNWDIVKNYTELIVTAKSILPVNGNWDDFTKVGYYPSDRIFKLSGRYQLNNDFKLSQYDDPNLSNKYVFSTRRKSQFPLNVTNGLTHQLMSRLWSWPTNKTDLVLSRYKLMLEDFIESLQRGNYRDIEHLIFKYFDGPSLIEFPIIGVTGQLGPNAQQVSD